MIEDFDEHAGALSSCRAIRFPKTPGLGEAGSRFFFCFHKTVLALEEFLLVFSRIGPDI